MSEHTRRFSDRVDDYVRYRPGYPDDLVTTLLDRSGLQNHGVAADIGSGTGIFTAKLLEAGLQVFGVEPNDEMRRAAEYLLEGYNGFTSIAAPAENTGLEDSSVDLITAAQAFHWFNNQPTREEFRRILKPAGHLALIWNRRRTEQAFQRDYDALLRERAPEYGKVNHMNLDDSEIAGFFDSDGPEKHHFTYRQSFEFESLLGRVKSSSYCPLEGSDAFRNLRAGLLELFEKHAVDGTIDFEYDTHLYLGHMA